ncbi:hypothetical protein AURDEDRAFT_186894 [Auricularia subglabra TFB-10046 SS5]|nr:hypothetical protein AURDEDRAFT_186894 [Auricularia subglabra TFB-10046 SS5]
MAELAAAAGKQVTPQAFCKLASITWLTYDIFLTFNDELEYIWKKRRWTLTKALYLLLRYTTHPIILYSVVANMRLSVSKLECRFLFIFEPAGTLWILLLAQGILHNRIYMMYGKDRKLLKINMGLWLLELIALAILAVFTLGKSKHPHEPPKGVLGSVCNRSAPGGIVYIAVVVAIFESYLLALIVRRGLQEHRVRTGENLKAMLGDSHSIIYALTRDSIVYWFMMVGSVLVFIIIIRVAPESPGEAAISFAHSAAAVGACRIILSALRAAHAPVDGSSRRTLVSHTTMQFQQRRTSETAISADGDDYVELDDLSASQRRSRPPPPGVEQP